MIGFDSETFPIRPGMLDPPVVSVAFSDGSLLLREAGIDHFFSLLEKGHTLVGHNVAFDVACFARHRPEKHRVLWDALKSGQIVCTYVREKLTQIKRGYMTKADLGYCVSHYAGMKVDKSDPWRLRYGELEGVPIEDWPVEAQRYAREDVRWLTTIYSKQHSSPDEVMQTCAAYVLHRIAMWGICTDGQKVAALEQDIVRDRDNAFQAVLGAGLLRQKKVKGQITFSKNMKLIRQLIADEFGEDAVKLTATGLIATGAEVVEDSQNPGLRALAEYDNCGKMLKTYIGPMKYGAIMPINSRPNVLVMTGRTSWAAPNLQNQPTKAGFRDCFMPRSGHLFVASDYKGIEIRTLGQSLKDLLGKSTIVERFRADPEWDMLSWLAAKMGRPRQSAKAVQYGFSGGLGYDTFRSITKKQYGIDVSMEEARELKRLWFEALPEMKEYFALITHITDNVGYATLPRSGRRRGRISYTQAANYFFQGPAADGGKLALIAAWEECVFGKGSLRGCGISAFIHDEILLEAPTECAPEAGDELARVMREAMVQMTPDVPSDVETVLMSRWDKHAKPKRDENGRLALSC